MLTTGGLFSCRCRNLANITVFWLLTTYGPLLMAQDNPAYLEHYTVNDGLPTQTIYNVLQDSKGFVWISSQAGVSRFDGKEFVNYTTDDGLGDNEVITLYEDRRGRIWFTPFGRELSYYREGRFYNRSNDVLLKNMPRQCGFNFAAEDRPGNLYIQTRLSRVVFVIDTANAVSSIDLTPVIGPDDAISILHTGEKEEQVYCITDKKRIFLLSHDQAQEILLPEDHILKKDSVIWFFNAASPKATTFLGSAGIYVLRDLNPVLLLPRNRIPDPESQFHSQLDHHGNLWISTTKHTYFFRYSDHGGYSNPLKLFNDLFAVPCFDREDYIWFCTGSRGLYRTSYKKLCDSASFHLNSFLIQRNVTSVHAGEDGALWLGYTNGHVTRLSPHGVVTNYNIGHGNGPSRRVLKILTDKEGDVWCATDETCILLIKKGRDHYKNAGLFRNTNGSVFIGALKDFFTDSMGAIYATKTTGHTKFNKESRSVEEIHRTLDPPERKYSSFIDREGRWYTSTKTGLQLYDKGIIRNLGQEDSLLNTRIQDMAQGSNGIIFLVTYNSGVIALKYDRVIAHLTRKEGLAGIIGRNIHVRNDTLYIATNGGVTIAVFQNRTFKVVENIGILEGLPSNDVNDLCLIGNSMYAATSEGMAVVHLPLKRQETAPPPILSLLYFKVNGRPLDLRSPIVLPYGHQQILVSYIAPAVDRPSSIVYRYRLNDGSGWHTTSSTQLEFSDLPHGSYAMEIQAKKYSSTWSVPARLVFSVTPPLYAKWWFRTLLALLIVSLLFILIRYILQRRLRSELEELRQKEVIEKERNRIAADIHDDIGAELTNIVILTRILKDGKPHEAPVNLVHKLEKSADEVIGKMNEVIWTLKASGDNLYNLSAHLRSFTSSFLNEYNLESNIHISDELYCDRPVSAEVSRNLFLILKESLHNVVKHAQASLVEVSIALNLPSSLLMTIRDNGRGFETRSVQNGNGLMNIKGRISAVNGTVVIHSTPDEGTEIRISVPLKE